MTKVGEPFKMTLKTKLFLWLHSQFWKVSQWFVNHCDYEEDFDWLNLISEEDEKRIREKFQNLDEDYLYGD